MAEFIINVVLYYVLIGIIVFGAFAIRRMLPKDRIVNQLFWLLIIFGGVYLIDSFNLIFGEYGYITKPIEMDYKNILIGISSQLFFQYFLYTLLFSRKTAIKWTIIQAIPPATIVLATWIADSMDIFSQFKALNYEDNITNNPLFLIRLSIVIIQLLYAIVVASFTFKLIPLYQLYIERTESNSARNMIWIREVYWLFLILSTVYTIDAFFSNFATALLYFAGAIWSFARVIILMLSNYTENFNINGDLYAEVGVKWSFKESWHMPPVTKEDIETDESLFNDVINWINKTHAYTNHNFSYRDVSEKFPQLDYKVFDELLRQNSDSNFQAYIRNLRIERAIELMNNTKGNTQLKSIADKVGFESSSSFSRAFKATKGITASQWRDNQE